MEDQKVQLHELHSKPAQLITLGDRAKALSAQVSKEVEDTYLDANDYILGAGGATPENLESTGDSFILNGLCYTRSTDENSSKYLSIISGRKFRSLASVLMLKKHEPNGIIKSQKLLHLSNFYYQALEEANYHTIAIMGLAKFKSVYVNIVHKPPIHGISFKDEKKHYFPFPSKVLHNVFGVFFAVIHKKGFSEKLDKRLNNPIQEHDEYMPRESIYSVNLFEKGIFNKGKLLILNKPVYSYADVKPSDVSNLWNVYLKESIISNFEGDYFLIDDIIDEV